MKNPDIVRIKKGKTTRQSYDDDPHVNTVSFFSLCVLNLLSSKNCGKSKNKRERKEEIF